MSAWIRMIPPAEASGYLRELYDRVKGPQGQVDNVMKAHSLRPRTMEGHLAIYKSVMHHKGNVLPVWFLECMAVYTGLVNRCAYFNYSTRLLNGLGVTTEGDTLGLSPPESADLSVSGYR